MQKVQGFVVQGFGFGGVGFRILTFHGGRGFPRLQFKESEKSTRCNHTADDRNPASPIIRNIP